MPVIPIQATRALKPGTHRIEPGAIVEYEQHGKPILAVVLAEKKGKWALLNHAGQELALEAQRLYLLPEKIPAQIQNQKERLQFLTQLEQRAAEAARSLDLESAWEVLSEKPREISVEELCDILYDKIDTVQLLAARRELLEDKVYFKRRKAGFEPRPAEVVAELKIQLQREREKAEQRRLLADALVSRVAGSEVVLPASVFVLEQLAALGSRAEGVREGTELMEDVAKRARLELHSNRIEDRAFQLLVAARHFTVFQNLDLIRFRRTTHFSPELLAEVDTLVKQEQSAVTNQLLDLTGLETFTIDSVETRDVDDAISLEETTTGYRLGVHISDVTWAVPPGSLVEREVFARATTIYCADQHIPMLPEQLSHQATSLIKDTKRRVMSFLFEVDRDLNILSRSIHRAVICVKHRLSYDEVDAVLYGEHLNSGGSTALEAVFLRLWQLTSGLEAKRSKRGAMSFARREMTVRLLANNVVAIEESNEDTPARKLISELMVLANETSALFARDNKLEIIFRSQEPPEKDLDTVGLDIENDIAREYFRRSYLKRSAIGVKPLAHFGLGLEAYTQMTSPIRRAFDLINQRQISHFLDTGHPFYPAGAVAELILSVEAALDEAVYIQRERNRYWLLQYLVQQKFEFLDGVVVKIDGPKPLAELWPINILYGFQVIQRGKGQKGEKRLGEAVRFKIEDINPRKGILRLSEVSIPQ